MTTNSARPTCADCQFYREPQKVPAALGAALPRITGQSQVLTKIAGRHAEQRVAEFANWVELSFSEVEDARWEPRPAASPYCGKLESDAENPRFLMAEVINAGGDCGFKPRTTPSSCGTCSHAVIADGQAQDEAEFNVRTRLVLLGDTNAISDMMKRVVEDQGQEIDSVHLNDGYLGGPPRYLDYCTHQAPGESGIVACAIKNSDQKCPFWTKPVFQPPAPDTR